VDGRDKPGHDEFNNCASPVTFAFGLCPTQCVIAGLDPAIQLPHSATRVLKLDHRVKPGDDAVLVKPPVANSAKCPARSRA